MWLSPKELEEESEKDDCCLTTSHFSKEKNKRRRKSLASSPTMKKLMGFLAKPWGPISPQGGKEKDPPAAVLASVRFFCRGLTRKGPPELNELGPCAPPSLPPSSEQDRPRSGLENQTVHCL